MYHFNKNDCIGIGHILKTYGLKGEVVAFVEKKFIENLNTSQPLFIDIDGGLVPFFISENGLLYKNDESVIIKFDFINSPSKAKDLIGCNLYIPNNEPNTEHNPCLFPSYIGMNVIDHHSGNLGQITKIDDYSGNIVVTVLHQDGEILIPLTEEIITGIDNEKRILYLECPDGLIDLYLQ